MGEKRVVEDFLQEQHEFCGAEKEPFWPRIVAAPLPEIRVQGSGFRAQGPGFRVQGSMFRAQGSGFRVQGSGRRVQGLVVGFMVYG